MTNTNICFLLEKYESIRKKISNNVYCESCVNESYDSAVNNIKNRCSSFANDCDNCSCNAYNYNCEPIVITPNNSSLPFTITNSTVAYCYDANNKVYNIVERYTFNNATNLPIFTLLKPKIHNTNITVNNINSFIVGNVFTINYSFDSSEAAVYQDFATETIITDGITSFTLTTLITTILQSQIC